MMYAVNIKNSISNTFLSTWHLSSKQTESYRTFDLYLSYLVMVKSSHILSKENVYHGSLVTISTAIIFLCWNEWNTYYFVTENIHEV